MQDTILIPEISAPDSAARSVLVTANGGSKPKTVAYLRDWEYLERAIHRMLCGWGRSFCEWDDKSSLHRHVWEQAECVRRLRERLAEFPGSTHNLDAPVAVSLEELCNTVLLAPTFEDAVDGIYRILSGALNESYIDYVRHAHPVHDAPTVALLHEILTIKEQQRLWLRAYRRRVPHTTDTGYRQRIEAALQRCGKLLEPQTIEGDRKARLVGEGIDFRLPAVPARPQRTRPQPGRKFFPFAIADFAGDIEARRLFWCYGYMLEHTLPDDQLLWLYSAPHMPWEFHHDISRHLWDESRHGESGRSRLLDFGITQEDIGFPMGEPTGDNLMEPLTPAELYERVFNCGMVAETGHFVVKREAYEDFRAGGDLESAEMMLFDIIDESAHVQYAHTWLPKLADLAGIDGSDYRERGAEARAARQAEHDAFLQRSREFIRDEGNPDWVYYQQLLQIMRDKQPLTNAATCPPRTRLPMGGG